MAAPAVSVIIPNYNSPVIDRVLDSVFSQDYEGNFEVVIAGLDAHGLIKPRKGLVFINTKAKKNPAEARNICIKNAKGSTLVLLDADCIPEKNWLRNLVASPHGVVQGGIDFSSENFWTFCDNFVHFYGSHFTKKGGEQQLLSTYNVKIPRRAFDGVGMFNERLETAEDDEFFLRLKRHGYRLFFEPKAVVRHEPNRKTFSALLMHSRYWSENAVRVRSKFPEYKWMPNALENRYIRLLFSPAIALYVTLRIFSHVPFLKYFYTAPIVYLCKLAWLFGSFKGEGATYA